MNKILLIKKEERGFFLITPLRDWSKNLLIKGKQRL